MSKKKPAIILLILLTCISYLLSSGASAHLSGSSGTSSYNGSEITASGDMTAASEIFDNINTTVSMTPLWIDHETDLPDMALLKESDVTDGLTGDISTSDIPYGAVQEFKYILDAGKDTKRIVTTHINAWILQDLKDMNILPDGYPYCIAVQDDDWMTIHVIIPVDEDYKALTYSMKFTRSGSNDIKVVRSIEKGGKISVLTWPQIYAMAT